MHNDHAELVVKLRDADKEIFMADVSVSHTRKGDLKLRRGASSNIQSRKRNSIEIFCSYTQALISSHSVSLENNEKADIEYSSTFLIQKRLMCQSSPEIDTGLQHLKGPEGKASSHYILPLGCYCNNLSLSLYRNLTGDLTP
jgi:hypothetical protein